MLILEGEDDERVWQQAARSSQSRIRIFPVLAQTVDQQTELESFSGPMLAALYDNPIAYSIRDGDGKIDNLDNIGPIVRFRLQCYAIENALVTTECLAVLNIDWNGFIELANTWVAANGKHKDIDLVNTIINSPDRMRHEKIKNIRQLIVSIAGSKKPWEVVVGQGLASITRASIESTSPFTLAGFIGFELSERLLNAP